ncbi:thiamine phosphate synthase [Nitratireductor sp. CAU 1489]|uniref:Thiamine phosphate synthase n=1 Tax=Nitratireductor arenosus TaxID=2682096 RepID=A0A844QKU1_9HYPH|nr:thiamine phosphate synthase [Nitratireductor arenosus]MVA98511.1 thiamine phosphate synthase [Nitratireductor arenosus]
MTEKPPNRCRLVLIAPQSRDLDTLAAQLERACAGGDVASLILPQFDMLEAEFQDLAERIVPTAQARGVAVVIAGAPRIAARAKADGIHVDTGHADLADAVSRYQPAMMVGAGGGRDRDRALELGELRPDYLFFGRFGYDSKPDPHPRNLALGRWWSEMIEIPCLVLAGSRIGSVVEVARTGAEFVAASTAVFAEDADPAAAVAEINRLLDDTASGHGTTR